jgi:hypothetical protein
MGKFLSLVLFLCGIVLVLFGVNRRPDPTSVSFASEGVAPTSSLPPFGWLLGGAAGVAFGLFGLTRNPNPV